jgi:hypothetical protein
MRIKICILHVFSLYSNSNVIYIFIILRIFQMKHTFMFSYFSDAVISAAAATQIVLCERNPSTGVSKECLPHCLWGLILTGSTSAPITISEQVAFEQDSYLFFVFY